ncbi:hypothetical protein [Variovorax sp. EL159]|uniref:hypothetical protein n=1 Tax=Variovorax sp. EL159 TaxID=1566270 RepID=UPI000884F5F6|nr:hypothetical protein [Variovorax sp. EL159]SCX48726.1 hypothetical protein SAMN03159363_1216 [Variovorax sp. EL159]
MDNSNESYSLDTICGTGADWAELEARHTEWYDTFEAGPWNMTRAELEALAKTAPNGFSRGLAYAWLAARQDVANQAQVPFL